MSSAIGARALIEALPEAVLLVDAEVGIAFVNSRAESLFGYAPGELQGCSLETVLPSRRTAPGRDSVTQLVLTYNGSASLPGEEVIGLKKSQEELPLEMHVGPLQLDGASFMIMMLRDRTAYVRERAFLQSALRTQSQLEGTTVGIVRVDDTGIITHINGVWSRFVENNRQHDPTCVGLGENCLEACKKSGEPWARQAADAMRALLDGHGESFSTTYSCHSPTQLRWFQLQARRPPDGSRAVVLTHIDATEQRLAQARARIQGCVADTFTARTSLLASCRELALIVCQELAWDFLGIWLPDTATWQLRCVDLWIRPGLNLPVLEQEKRQMQLPPGVGLPGRVWGTRRPEWVRTQASNGEAEKSGMPRAARQAGFRSGFAFAIKYDDDVLAVIEVFGRICQEPDPGLLAFLEQVGVQLAAAELRERAEHRATAAQGEVDAAREQLEAVLACVPALVIAIDRSGALQFVNRAAADTLALELPAGTWKAYVPAVAREPLERALREVLNGGPPRSQDVTVTAPDGGTTWFTNYLGPIRSGDHVTGALIVSADVTQVKQAQHELFGAQRLAAIGTLAAGVAHEINTPIQFVGDSIDFLRDASRDTAGLVDALLALRAAFEEKADPARLNELIEQSREAEEQADLEYLKENVPKAFDRCADGLNRVTSIVRSMKEFSHPSHDEMAPVDLNRAIMATLTVARNEYKYIAELVTELGDLPPIMCFVNDINQVVLNIVINAAHAIQDVVQATQQRGVIRVRTYIQGEHVIISVSDTGGGIPEAVRDRIFDPFFTTKEVGRGTGQGLAIAWRAVKEKHAGELTFESELGVGTTFSIKIPIAGKCPVEGTV